MRSTSGEAYQARIHELPTDGSQSGDANWTRSVVFGLIVESKPRAVECGGCTAASCTDYLGDNGEGEGVIQVCVAQLSVHSDRSEI